MVATELQSKQSTVAKANAAEVSGKVAQQVSQILEEADRKAKVPRPALSYRVPSPGVRCYF